MPRRASRDQRGLAGEPGEPGEGCLGKPGLDPVQHLVSRWDCLRGVRNPPHLAEKLNVHIFIWNFLSLQSWQKIQMEKKNGH